MLSDTPKPPLFTNAYLIIAASNLLMLTGFGIFLVFPLFILHIGGSKTDIGILMGIMPLSAVLCRPLISVQVDRIGRKKSYIIGCIIMAMVSFSYRYFDRNIDAVFFFHFFLRFIHGIGFAFCIVASYTLVTDLIPVSRFNEGFGFFGVTGLFGIAAGPILAEWLIRRIGFDAMFICSTSICLAALVIALPIRDMYTFQRQENGPSFFKVFRHPVLLRITLIGVCFGVGFSAHSSFVAPYAQNKGLLVSTYFAAYSAAAILTRISGGRLADRLGEVRIIPFGLVGTATGFISLTQIDTSTGLFAAGFITGMGHGILFPCLVALAIRPTPPQNRGKANGVFTGGVDSGIFCGSLFLGLIGEYLGYSKLFFVASGSFLIGLVFFLRWRPLFKRATMNHG